MTVGNKLKDYYELTKPKIWYLLVFTAFGATTASFLFNVPISLLTWMLLLGGVATGSAAADTLTGYNDRDIDAIMERTKKPANTIRADISKESPDLWADIGSNFTRLRMVYQYLGIWLDGFWPI